MLAELARRNDRREGVARSVVVALVILEGQTPSIGIAMDQPG